MDSKYGSKNDGAQYFQRGKKKKINEKIGRYYTVV